MKRKTSSVPSRIWVFGLPFGPEPECAERVGEQIKLGHRYRNKLVELERQRRTLFRDERARLYPELPALEAAVAKIDAEIECLDRKDPMRKKLYAAIKTEREQLKALRAQANLDPRLKTLSESVNVQANAAGKLARAECGAYWGTYLLHENDFQQGLKAAKTDPEFRKYRGAGFLGVQLQGGLSTAEAMACTDTQLRIEVVPGKRAVRQRGVVSAKTSGKRDAVLHVRVGSTEKGKPIWAKFKMVLHRPLPADAKIKWVRIRRLARGPNWRWDVCLTLEAQSFEVAPKLPGPVVAINFGWRKFSDEHVRVGYVLGTDGLHEEITIPSTVQIRIKKSDDIQSIRGSKFEAMRNALRAWIDARRDREVSNLNGNTCKVEPVQTGPEGAISGVFYGGALPEWLLVRTRTLAYWRSENALRALAEFWNQHRFAGDETIFPELWYWRGRERHLFEYEAEQRADALLFRKEQYRLLATRLARRYSTIVLHDLDLRKFQEKTGDAERDQHKPQRKNRTQAALSELRSALILAASNAGTRILTAPETLPITKTCSVCGQECTWDHSKQLRHVCEHCGAEWDQDENAARNLLVFSQRDAAE